MLDEKALRRPTFDLEDTVPVQLGDGQEWFVPRVWLTFTPVFRGGKATETKLTSSIGTEFDELRQNVQDASERGEDLVLAAINLGAFMLLKNYDLDDGQLASVLSLPANPEKSWIRGLMDVANGVYSPKELTSGGSNAPS